ncbi:MAG: hypothetical protein OXC37_00415 [Bdellovibrionaceae bacterium]|nr:hypothetical protein [Pseudobdellovibrionaceae bacterium]
MKLSKNLLLLFQFLIFLPAIATEKVFPAKDIKSFTIQIPSLNLNIKHSNSSNYTIKGGEDLEFQIEQGEFSIKSKDFSIKSAWSNKTKSINLEIFGPSKDLQIFSFKSKISISNWIKSVFISSFKSQINSNNTKGSWKLSLKEGSVSMLRHNNSLNLKAFQANLKLSQSEGNFNFQINEGKVTIKKSKGKLTFNSDKPKIHLTQFTGDIKGFNQQGDIRASIQADELDISTKQGAVRLYFMKQGPKIKAYTEEGKIYAPRYFYKKFSGKSTYVSGRIKSKISKGNASIKTEIGNIYIN